MADDRAKYDAQFYQLQPVAGFLTGPISDKVVKTFFSAVSCLCLVMCLKPRSHQACQHASTRFDASNQTNVKDSKHSQQPRRTPSICVDTRHVICIHRMSDVSLDVTLLDF